MNLKDSDLIHILLTSEFDDVQKKEDFKYLLFRFREFYRILHSKLGVKSGEVDSLNREYQDKIKRLEEKIYSLEVKNASLQDTIDLSLPKKKPKRWKNIFNKLFKS